MKALLFSRPGDFGALEEAWPGSPLLIPMFGKTILQWHSQFLISRGIDRARLIVASPGRPGNVDRELQAALEARPCGVEWSLRPWTTGAYPHGQTMTTCLRNQSLFVGGEPALVLSAPLLFLEPLLGPQVPPGFPVSESRILAPQVLRENGSLVPAEFGTPASLASVRDFYATTMKLLTTMPPRPTSLKRVHSSADLAPPVYLGPEVRVAANASVGPQTVLESGVRVGKGCKVSQSIVLTDVELGEGFELSEKIVVGTTVLSPVWGARTTLFDEKLLRDRSKTAKGPRWADFFSKPAPIRTTCVELGTVRSS